MPAAIAERCLRVDADWATPRYFSDRDVPWISALLAEYRAFEGERRAELRERLREPFPVRAPYAKLGVLDHLLDEFTHDRICAALAPAEARWLLFRTATQFPGPREEILVRAAEAASVEVQALEAALFADLASERRVGALPASLSASDCIPLANRALVAGLLSRAVELRVMMKSELSLQAFARQAQRLGLICSGACSSTSLAETRAASEFALYVSGPLALFQHSQLYARSMASLVPALVRRGPFELAAACRFERVPGAPPLRVGGSDPLGREGAVPEPDPLLSRLVAEFRALSDEWEVEESTAVSNSGGVVVCPQLELWDKARPARRFPLHVVRFWTEPSLASLLAWAELHHGLIWVDAAGRCDEMDASVRSSFWDDDGAGPRALFFRKRPDARKLLTWLREQP